jgi:hypothetical protein
LTLPAVGVQTATLILFAIVIAPESVPVLGTFVESGTVVVLRIVLRGLLALLARNRGHPRFRFFPDFLA